jgi:hypothetical protein
MHIPVLSNKSILYHRNEETTMISSYCVDISLFSFLHNTDSDVFVCTKKDMKFLETLELITASYVPSHIQCKRTLHSQRKGIQNL